MRDRQKTPWIVRLSDEGGLESLRNLDSKLSFRIVGNIDDEEGDRYASSKPMSPVCERGLQGSISPGQNQVAVSEKKKLWEKEVENLNHSRLGGEMQVMSITQRDKRTPRKVPKQSVVLWVKIAKPDRMQRHSGQFGGTSQDLKALESG